jgi:hypothetical protein
MVRDKKIILLISSDEDEQTVLMGLMNFFRKNKFTKIILNDNELYQNPMRNYIVLRKEPFYILPLEINEYKTFLRENKKLNIYGAVILGDHELEHTYMIKEYGIKNESILLINDLSLDLDEVKSIIHNFISSPYLKPNQFILKKNK